MDDISIEGREYSVVIAPHLLVELPRRFAVRFPNSHTVVLTDNRVWDLYGADLAEGLTANGIEVDDIVIPEGEASKSLDIFSGIIEELHHHRFDKESILVNLGGGMITDLGGFVASSYRGGVRMVHVPTTLLAQQDAVFGSRVGINTHWSKNFIGSVCRPEAIYTDTSVLRTLSHRDFCSGLAATLRIAIAHDEPLFRLLEEVAEAVVIKQNPEAIHQLVLRASQVRLSVPGQLGRDLGLPFAHALEAACRYGSVLHGEALAWGIAVATAISNRCELLDDVGLARMFRLMANCGQPPELPAHVLQMAVERIDLGATGELVVPVAIGKVDTYRPSVADVQDAVQMVQNDSRLAAGRIRRSAA